MVRIAVSGHRNLPPATTQLVNAALKAALVDYESETLHGITCLADGADQLFAQAVLDHGGTLSVVVPASRYRDGLPEDCWPTYDALLKKASHVIRLDHVDSTETAHMEASARMLAEADILFAVWDGRPARGYGGTADVVAEARRQGIAVTVIWPEGASRD